MAKMFIITPRMPLVCLLVSLVLVFEAADASFVKRINHLSPTPNPPAASRSMFLKAHYLMRRNASPPPATIPEAPPTPSDRLKNDDTEIGYAAMHGDETPCDPNNEANCAPAKSGNRYVRGCSPAERCRCCRKMLLEAQLS